MIGVFDSGLGGILLLEKLAKKYPHQTFLYHADREHAPFGTKTDEELIEIFNRNYDYYLAKNCSDLIVACNTLCSTIDFSSYKAIKIHDIISSTIEQIDLAPGSNILILGTDKTIEKGRYADLLIKKGHLPISKPLSKLASMIEDYHDIKEIDSYIHKELEDIRDIDAVILACTHYPAVIDIFQNIFNVPIYDSNDLTYSFLSDDNDGKVLIDLKKDDNLEKYLQRHVRVEYKFYEDSTSIR